MPQIVMPWPQFKLAGVRYAESTDNIYSLSVLFRRHHHAQRNGVHDEADRDSHRQTLATGQVVMCAQKNTGLAHYLLR